MSKIITAGIPQTGVMREIASGLPLGVASVDENILRDPVVDVLSVTYDDGFFTAQIRVRTFFTEEQIDSGGARINMVVNDETLYSDIVSNTTVCEWVYYVNPETPIDTFNFAGHCTAEYDSEQSNDVEFYVSLLDTVTVDTPKVSGEGTTLATVTAGDVVAPEGLPTPSSVVLRVFDGSEYTDYPSPHVLTADEDKTFLVATFASWVTGEAATSSLVEVAVAASSMSDITEQVAALDTAVFGNGVNKGLVERVDNLETPTINYVTASEFAALLADGGDGLQAGQVYQITDYEFAGGIERSSTVTGRVLSPQSFHRTRCGYNGQQTITLKEEKPDWVPISFDLQVTATGAGSIAKTAKLVQPHTRQQNWIAANMYDLNHWLVEVELRGFSVDVENSISAHGSEITHAEIAANTICIGVLYSSYFEEHGEQPQFRNLDYKFALYRDGESLRVAWLGNDPNSEISEINEALGLELDGCDPATFFGDDFDGYLTHMSVNQYNEEGKENNKSWTFRCIAVESLQPVGVTRMVSQSGNEANFDFIDLGVGALQCKNESPLPFAGQYVISPYMVGSLFCEEGYSSVFAGAANFGELVAYYSPVAIGANETPVMIFCRRIDSKDPDFGEIGDATGVTGNEGLLLCYRNIKIEWIKTPQFDVLDAVEPFPVYNPPVLQLPTSTYFVSEGYAFDGVDYKNHVSGADCLFGIVGGEEINQTHDSVNDGIFRSWLECYPERSQDVVRTICHKGEYAEYRPSVIMNVHGVRAIMAGEVRDCNGSGEYYTSTDKEIYPIYNQVPICKDLVGSYVEDISLFNATEIGDILNGNLSMYPCILSGRGKTDGGDFGWLTVRASLDFTVTNSLLLYRNDMYLKVIEGGDGWLELTGGTELYDGVYTLNGKSAGTYQIDVSSGVNSTSFELQATKLSAGEEYTVEIGNHTFTVHEGDSIQVHITRMPIGGLLTVVENGKVSTIYDN